MTKVLQTLPFSQRCHRNVSACLGILAVLFQIIIPLTGAIAADQSGRLQSNQFAQIICTAGGRLITINPENPSPNDQMAACEFCLICQPALFGNNDVPNSAERTVTFASEINLWTERSRVEHGNSSDDTVRPVRAPPVFV